MGFWHGRDVRSLHNECSGIPEIPSCVGRSGGAYLLDAVQ